MREQIEMGENNRDKSLLRVIKYLNQIDSIHRAKVRSSIIQNVEKTEI